MENKLLPEMPIEELRRRQQIDNESEIISCECFIYSGYKLPDDVWCDYCLGPKTVECNNCKKELILSFGYKGKRYLCTKCRKNKNNTKC